MPQLEGQPGSRGMNPPGGISTINLYNWSEPTQPAALRRNHNQLNDDSVVSHDNTASRPSAGLSPSENIDNRGITRMHQVRTSSPTEREISHILYLMKYVDKVGYLSFRAKGNS